MPWPGYSFPFRRLRLSSLNPPTGSPNSCCLIRSPPPSLNATASARTPSPLELSRYWFLFFHIYLSQPWRQGLLCICTSQSSTPSLHSIHICEIYSFRNTNPCILNFIPFVDVPAAVRPILWITTMPRIKKKKIFVSILKFTSKYPLSLMTGRRNRKLENAENYSSGIICALQWPGFIASFGRYPILLQLLSYFSMSFFKGNSKENH